MDAAATVPLKRSGISGALPPPMRRCASAVDFNDGDVADVAKLALTSLAHQPAA